MPTRHTFAAALTGLFVFGASCTSSSPTYNPTPSTRPTNSGSDASASMGSSAVDVRVGANGGFQFSPADVTIAVGQTVRFTWVASGHSVTSGSNGTADGKFCSADDSACDRGALSPSGTVYSHTFNSAGTFPYFCAAHFNMGMTGTVTVR